MGDPLPPGGGPLDPLPMQILPLDQQVEVPLAPLQAQVPVQPPVAQFDETSPTYAVLKYLTDNGIANPKMIDLQITIRPMTNPDGTLFLEESNGFLRGKAICEFHYQPPNGGATVSHILALDINTRQLKSNVPTDPKALRELSVKLTSQFKLYSHFHESVIKACCAERPDATQQKLAARVDEIRQNGAVRIVQDSKPSGAKLPNAKPIRVEQWKKESDRQNIASINLTAAKVDTMRRLIRDPQDESNYALLESLPKDKAFQEQGKTFISEQDMSLLLPSLRVGADDQQAVKMKNLKAKGATIQQADLTAANVTTEDFIKELRSDFENTQDRFNLVRDRILQPKTGSLLDIENALRDRLGKPARSSWTASINLVLYNRRKKKIEDLTRTIQADPLGDPQIQGQLDRLKKFENGRTYEEVRAEVLGAVPIMKILLKSQEKSIDQLEALLADQAIVQDQKDLISNELKTIEDALKQNTEALTVAEGLLGQGVVEEGSIIETIEQELDELNEKLKVMSEKATEQTATLKEVEQPLDVFIQNSLDDTRYANAKPHMDRSSQLSQAQQAVKREAEAIRHQLDEYISGIAKVQEEASAPDKMRMQNYLEHIKRLKTQLFTITQLSGSIVAKHAENTRRFKEGEKERSALSLPPPPDEADVLDDGGGLGDLDDG